MLLIVFIIILLLILLIILKKQKLEEFYPAWNNHVLYNELSTRLRIGIWKEWINLNHLQFMEKLTTFTNSEIRLYNSNRELLNDLLIEKKIDIAFLTEAEYGIYIISTLMNSLETDEINRDLIINNREIINKKYNTRKLYTLYPMYRVLITNNFKIGKPSDITNKTIRITNYSNNFYKMDLDLLKNYKYNIVFKGDDNERGRYEDTNSLNGAIDGFFTIYNNPDNSLKFMSENSNINLIDLYSDKDNNSKFPKADDMKHRYFFLKKDKMDLIYYPKIIQRRKQSIDFYNLSYNPRYLNCYSYKTILLTREDVNDEAIYLFTKKLYENIDKLKKNIPYFEFLNKSEMFTSALDDILLPHRALFNSK